MTNHPSTKTAALLAALACAAAAHAQFTPGSTVTFSLDWLESDAAGVPLPSPNGALDPGEHALLRLTVSFNNQNTVATFSPPIGTFTSGTIRGFGGGWIDLVGAGGAEGAWNLDPELGLGLLSGWDVTGHAGTPSNGGAILSDLQPGQFPQPASVNTQNPIPGIWSGVWTPASYSSRLVSFQSAANPGAGPHPSSVLLRAAPIVLLGAFCLSDLGSVHIPIAPSPASLLCLALLLTRRRRTPSRTAPRPGSRFRVTEPLP